ncbi:hypothetical protein BU16DRAFT_531956 [Lophium mytilinum]|uniref:Anaphase-promoting complex subunit 5 n=1 Tax=Lophium mytilinum TaxID=390894 RepID=A0A6A6Q9C9_9PEZI|nr:hypothetical protein BU16DRAFT_531956 [Lophium mytilinum]
MSRYLTPHKISLLVLASLYCEAVVPTSATIPVLSFIISHIIPPAPSNYRQRDSSTSPDAVSSISIFDNVTLAHASSVPGRTLLDLFLKKLWEINSFDALHTFFDELTGILSPSRDDAERDLLAHVFLSRTSPLGTFVRRAQLEFTRLQFHDAVQLWSAFLKYKTVSPQWTKRITRIAGSGIDVNVTDLGLRPEDGLFQAAYGHLDDLSGPEEMVSVDDIERILEFQVDRIQRLGCRLPDDMRSQLHGMIGPAGTVLRSSHLVKFFDAWRAGDYTTAFDNLHRYYDYAMQTRDKIHYQYALLHMAILHAEFGCLSEAVAAINETISTARENQDMSCLNFSLSWLNHMSKAYPKQMKKAGYMGLIGSERDGLAFLKQKAKETKMYNLLSSTLLNEAKLGLSNGESIPRAIEHIYQASHLNIRENIVANYGGQMLMQSALFTRLGMAHLSNVYCELLLHCYHVNCPMEETIRALCRCAYTVSQSGRYDEGIAMLESIAPEAHRTLKFHQLIFNYTGLIKLKRAIRRTQLLASSHLLSQLSSSGAQDLELSFLLSLARIDFLTLSGRFSNAFDVIEDAAASLKEEGADIYQRVTILLAKATLFAKAGKPEKGFSVALRAASTSSRARLMPSLWEAVGRIAHILNGMGECRAASRLLSSVLPQALESSDLSLCADLYSIQADAYMGLAGLEDGNTSAGLRQRATNVNKADLYIDRARECAKRIEDISIECEMLAKKALIAKLRGDEKLAGEWAENYLQTYNAAHERSGVGERE